MKFKEYLKWYREFLFLSKTFWKHAIFAGILSILISLLSIPGPFLTKYAVDKIFPSKNINLLNIIVLAIFSLMVFKLISNFMSNLFLFLFRNKSTIFLQFKLFEHMQNLDMEFHQNYNTGERVSRLLNDTGRLQGLMVDIILTFLRNLLTFIVGTGALFFLNWKLALWSILLLPFYLYSINFFSPKIRQVSEKVQQEYSHLYHLFFENFYSIPFIKTFCLEKRQSQIVFEQLVKTFLVRLKSRKLSLISSSIASLIGALGPIIILWLGGREIMLGNLTLGGFIAFNSFLGYVYSPAQTIVGINDSIQTSLASLKRIFEILKLPQEEKGRIKLNKIKGNILFKEITFSYNSNSPLIKDLLCEIKQGEKILIMGKSGSGKTTLVNLLLKFYMPQKGMVFIDGVNLKDIETISLRKRIGVVFQNSFIFTGTIRENLLISDHSASEEKIIDILNIVKLDNLVMRLPKGIDTCIGERGLKISAGQAQRLSIARVILKNPDILIFDEATSCLDQPTEKLIYEKIVENFEDKTIIFISHKSWSIINYIDRVLLMENGRLIEIDKKEDYVAIFNYKFYGNKI